MFSVGRKDSFFTKIELDLFRSQHFVHVCLLSETILSAGKYIRVLKYILHRTDQITSGDNCNDQLHHIVTVAVLTHLETTVINIIRSAEL